MNELLQGTIAEAVEKLAAYSVALKSGREKSAAPTDFLASLGSTLKENPTLTSSLAGAGIGAGLGGISTALGNRGKDPSERKGFLGSMLTGGLAGAGIGAGASMARQGLSGMKGPNDPMGTDALRPGQFVDPATGQKMMIDPKALKDNPDLHKQVKSLTTPSTQSRIAGGVGGFLGAVGDQAPVTSRFALGAGAVDFALHNPLFGIARADPTRVGGYIGRELAAQGIGADKNIGEKLKSIVTGNQDLGGKAPRIARPPLANAGDIVPGERVTARGKSSPGGGQSFLGRLFKGRPQGAMDVVGGEYGPGKGSETALKVKYVEPKEVKLKAPDMDETVKRPGKIKTERMTEGQLGQAKLQAYRANEAYNGRNLYQLFGKSYRGMPSFGKAMALRAGIYGVPMAGEYLARGVQEDTQNRQTLRELMQQHAKPVPEGK